MEKSDNLSRGHVFSHLSPCLPVTFFLSVCHLNPDKCDKNKSCQWKCCRYTAQSPASLHDSRCTEALVTRRRVLFSSIVIIYGVCLQFDSETARWLTALRPPSKRNCASGVPGMKPVRNKNRKSNQKSDASVGVLLRSLTAPRERFDIAFFVGDWVWQ